MSEGEIEAKASPEEDSIVLVGDGDGYWLLEGEEYLSAMLSAEAYYPTPVKFLEYGSIFELSSGLGDGVEASSLWAIHPGIIDRLRREKLIVEERR